MKFADFGGKTKKEGKLANGSGRIRSADLHVFVDQLSRGFVNVFTCLVDDLHSVSCVW